MPYKTERRTYYAKWSRVGWTYVSLSLYVREPFLKFWKKDTCIYTHRPSKKYWEVDEMFPEDWDEWVTDAIKTFEKNEDLRKQCQKAWNEREEIINIIK